MANRRSTPDLSTQPKPKASAPAQPAAEKGKPTRKRKSAASAGANATANSSAIAEEINQQFPALRESEFREHYAALASERLQLESETRKLSAIEQELTAAIERVRRIQEEQLRRLERFEAELRAQESIAKQIEELARTRTEILKAEVVSEARTVQAEPRLVTSESFAFEVNAPTSTGEEIIIGNQEYVLDEPISPPASKVKSEEAKGLSLVAGETGIAAFEDVLPTSQAARRLQSADPAERCEALMDLAQLRSSESFHLITNCFDDSSPQVRNAAARALCDLNSDRAASLTQALREAPPDRRRRIGAAFAGSGLASQAINCLAGESRELTYDAFTILFLMAKAGEVQPLIETIESHSNIAVRLAVIKLLAFSNQTDVIAAFRRLAVRASLPAEVRSAVMEAIHDMGTAARQSRVSAA